MQKTALIVGMARSGIGAAKLLDQCGWRVLVNDRKIEIPGLAEALAGTNCIYKLGLPPESLFDGVSLMVISPVIPMTRPFVQEAIARGVEVISEIELGYRYAKADFICITGTNGKTTSTALTGALFQTTYPTYVLGNIGVPITEHAFETKKGEYIVAETAALQLEGCRDFHARAAGFCNLTEDHLDHFGTMERYLAAKCRIFANQTADDFAVLNYDDPIVRGLNRLTPAKTLYFSRKTEVCEGMFLRDGKLIYRRDGAETALLAADEIRIPGGHNIENAMLSALLALAMGVPQEKIAAVLRTFPGVEHRNEFVREVAGVRYYNDSKGTNPASTIRAIEAMGKMPTVLLLGGYDKQNSFDELFAAMGESVRHIVVLGATKDKILDAARASGKIDLCTEADTFLAAVEKARALAVPGGAVLLSPACASWDMFDNFEQRGDVFKQIVADFS